MIQLTTNGNDLFYESYFKTFFRSSPLAVLEAEYTFNRGIATETGLSTLAYFYYCLDLKPPKEAGAYGWNYTYLWEEWASAWVDFVHRPALTEDGEPYCEISYPMEPKPMEYLED